MRKVKNFMTYSSRKKRDAFKNFPRTFLLVGIFFCTLNINNYCQAAKIFSPLFLLYHIGSMTNYLAQGIMGFTMPSCAMYNNNKGLAESRCSCEIGYNAVQCQGWFEDRNHNKQPAFLRVSFDSPAFQTSIYRMKGGTRIQVESNDARQISNTNKRARKLGNKKISRETGRKDKGSKRDGNLRDLYAKLNKKSMGNNPFPTCRNKFDPKLKGKACQGGMCSDIPSSANFMKPKISEKDIKGKVCDRACETLSEKALSQPTCGKSDQESVIQNMGSNIVIGGSLKLKGVSCDGSIIDQPKKWYFKKHEIDLKKTNSLMLLEKNEDSEVLLIKDLQKSQVDNGSIYMWTQSMQSSSTAYSLYNEETVLVYFPGDTCETYSGLRQFKKFAQAWAVVNNNGRNIIIIVTATISGVLICTGTVFAGYWYIRKRNDKAGEFKPAPETKKKRDPKQISQHQRLLGDIWHDNEDKKVRGDNQKKSTTKDRKNKKSNQPPHQEEYHPSHD